jgi:hypothetical protein
MAGSQNITNKRFTLLTYNTTYWNSTHTYPYTAVLDEHNLTKVTHIHNFKRETRHIHSRQVLQQEILGSSCNMTISKMGRNQESLWLDVVM